MKSVVCNSRNRRRIEEQYDDGRKNYLSPDKLAHIAAIANSERRGHAQFHEDSDIKVSL